MTAPQRGMVVLDGPMRGFRYIWCTNMVPRVPTPEEQKPAPEFWRNARREQLEQLFERFLQSGHEIDQVREWRPGEKHEIYGCTVRYVECKESRTSRQVSIQPMKQGRHYPLQQRYAPLQASPINYHSTKARSRGYTGLNNALTGNFVHRANNPNQRLHSQPVMRALGKGSRLRKRLGAKGGGRNGSPNAQMLHRTRL